VTTKRNNLVHDISDDAGLPFTEELHAKQEKTRKGDSVLFDCVLAGQL
jgi:hypothetical protein